VAETIAEYDHCDWRDCPERGVDTVEGRHYCQPHHAIAWSHEMELRGKWLLNELLETELPETFSPVPREERG
jgi:hypothetical protein